MLEEISQRVFLVRPATACKPYKSRANPSFSRVPLILEREELVKGGEAIFVLIIEYSWDGGSKQEREKEISYSIRFGDDTVILRVDEYR